MNEEKKTINSRKSLLRHGVELSIYIYIYYVNTVANNT